MHTSNQARPATLYAVVAGLNPERSVELRLLNHQGWHPVGNVTIPGHQAVPRVGDILEVRYRHADRDSKLLCQPTYLGRRKDIEHHECVMSQLKYEPEPALQAGSAT